MIKEQSEAQNASTQDFVKERIKARPINKAKFVRKMLTTVVSALIFGCIFCVIFLLLEPKIDGLLHKDEGIQYIVFPEEIEEEEMLPEEMLTEEQDQLENIDNSLGISDYVEMQEALLDLANTVRRSMVSVTGIHSENNWFENSYQNKSFSSGVIVADNGLEYLILVKTSHLGKAESYVAVFYNDKQASAVLKQMDTTTGYGIIAVSKDSLSEVDRENITVATLGSSNLSTILGTTVVALGNPVGTGDGICYGCVTSVGTPVNLIDSNYKLLTTDIYGSTQASGVLVNTRGHVIGIIDNSYNQSDIKNIVSALGISEMKMLIQNLSNDIPIAYLGIKGVSVTTSVNANYGVPHGAYVTNVILDSPAMIAGIQSGDVITEFDGAVINSFADLTRAVYGTEIGKTVKLKVERESSNGYKDMTIKVTLK